MKRVAAIAVLTICLFGCSGANYKQVAIEYLKTKVDNPASVDTVKFFKRDSIYTSFYDTRLYYNLKFERDSLLSEKNVTEAAKISSILIDKIKTYPKTITGWDIKLIYKVKDKSGKVKTDTCRFTFDSNLSAVKYVNGTGLKE